MLRTSKYPSRPCGGPEMVREVLSRTRTEGNRMADEKKSKMSRRSFLQKTAVGAAALRAVNAGPANPKKNQKGQASPPPGGVETAGIGSVRGAGPGALVVMWGTPKKAARE